MTLRHKNCRGFGLVEVLIAATLGLMLLGTLIGIYLATKRSYDVQDNLARMQENARLALRLIEHDVRMAGYRGDVTPFWTIVESTDLPLGSITNECHAGWARSLVLPTDGIIAAPITGSNDLGALFNGCVSSSDHIPGSDILSVHFAAADPLDDSAIEAGKIYLRGTLSRGMIFLADTDKALPADFNAPGRTRNYRLIATTYYLRPWSAVAPSKANPAGDAIPTLMRATLSDCGAKACVKSEGLIEGIANLQLQFGVDRGADDGSLAYLNADQLGDFTQAAGKAQWRHVRTVRIGLLVRSLNTQPDYSDPNAPYHLGDQVVNVTAAYRNLWLTSTVALRNGLSD